MNANMNAPSAVSELPIDELTPFADHPFRLYTGVKFDAMVNSVRENAKKGINS